MIAGKPSLPREPSTLRLPFTPATVRDGGLSDSFSIFHRQVHTWPGATHQGSGRGPRSFAAGLPDVHSEEQVRVFRQDQLHLISLAEDGGVAGIE